MPCSRRSSTSPKRLAGAQRRHVVQLHPAQGGADPGGQLLGNDGLGDVVVGTGLEPGDQVVGVGLGGDDDDRHDARGPQVAADLEAAHVGQPQIEQHQVRLPFGERGQPGPAVFGLADLVALVLEGQAQRQPDGIVVFDEQQGMHCAEPTRVWSFCYRKRTDVALSCHIGLSR